MCELGSDLLWAALFLVGSSLSDLLKQDALVSLDVGPRDVQQPLDLVLAVRQLEGPELSHHCFDFLCICRKQSHTGQFAEYGFIWCCCGNQRDTTSQNENSYSGSPAAGPPGLQTFAVGSVEERHVYDCGLLLFPLKHVTIFRPVSLLQDLVIDLWERLLSVLSIFLCKTQGL